jgi:hypothetical protein
VTTEQGLSRGTAALFQLFNSIPLLTLANDSHLLARSGRLRKHEIYSTVGVGIRIGRQRTVISWGAVERRGSGAYSAHGRSSSPGAGSRGGQGPGRSPGSRTPPSTSPSPSPPSPPAAAMRTEIVSDGEEATLVYVVLSWAWALEISRREGRGGEPSRAERCCGFPELFANDRFSPQVTK